MPYIPQKWIDFVPCLKAGKHLDMLQKILELRQQGKVIFPLQEHIFSFLEYTLPEEVRVIILGQDPYHGTYKGMPQAQGLAFSVGEHMPPPPSLKNIFKEIQQDLYGEMQEEQSSMRPNLVRLAKQGVLLLNTVLTVEEGLAGSHAKLGWQAITQDILQALAQRRQPVAVLLWGNPAKAYAPLFANIEHLVLMAAHPSPLSASRGFLGCKHFSKVNAWLIAQGYTSINWR